MYTNFTLSYAIQCVFHKKRRTQWWGFCISNITSHALRTLEYVPISAKLTLLILINELKKPLSVFIKTNNNYKD